jgi:hypothetical protein
MGVNAIESVSVCTSAGEICAWIPDGQLYKEHTIRPVPFHVCSG